MTAPTTPAAQNKFPSDLLTSSVNRQTEVRAVEEGALLEHCDAKRCMYVTSD